ncbi:hypothetical protein O3G_MSEX011548 [Manduca sexta]|uniref:Folylpolyglutamate synthase n=2 Tax=Manduca sexta TaxID=7130 RepID=A0A921ZM34_MANSE|nr:hypothetical protein O3G_MSEX011548 [Manduca sexta]
MVSTKNSYEDAVGKLNKLQSNKSTIEQIRKEKAGHKCTNVEDMEYYLKRTGVSLSKLDEMSVIHVAGTKGKGSTSAMCESILRYHGFRTGFYSSPHLVAVRERIRLDGKVVSEEQFAHYFHEVYGKLDSSKAFEGDMPKYFAFLTVMAFNVFLEEKVDVAIVEVGIGGIVDYTNVLRKVPVVGITALGLDHTSILGTTLPEIAAAKAGVMKRGCEAYTVQQPQEAMDVLKSYADYVKCPLTVVPEYTHYKFPLTNGISLPINLEAYQTNASLAVQLSHAWMRIRKHGRNGFKNGLNGLKNGVNGTVLKKIVTELNEETVKGLTSCKWPGRYQIVETQYATFYLDGAHTKESVEICAEWFKDRSRHRPKALIFSATGDRNGKVLLKPLKEIGFDRAFFVIPTANKKISQNSDNFSLVEQDELIQRCQRHAEIWSGDHTSVMECVADALLTIEKEFQGEKSSILVTGSLHLVGAVLSILDPNLSS